MNDDYLDIQKYIIDEMAKKMTYDIDKIIFDTITTDSTMATYIFEESAPTSQAELKEGESHCEDCDGWGKIEKDKKWYVCKECQGTGKLDWVERVVGKKPISIDDWLIDSIIPKKMSWNLDYNDIIRPDYTENNKIDYKTNYGIGIKLNESYFKIEGA